MDVAVGQQQIGERIHALCAQKWLGREFDRVDGAAIDQEVVLFAGCIEVNCRASIQRKDIEARHVAGLPELPGPEEQGESETGEFQRAKSWLEEPTGYHSQKDGVIQ